MKNHADDSKIESLLKIDFKAEWTHESMPTAWELKLISSFDSHESNIIFQNRFSFLCLLIWQR